MIENNKPKHIYVKKNIKVMVKCCPFCGTNDVSINDYTAVFCTQCAAIGPTATTEYDAVTKWNNRKGD